MRSDSSGPRWKWKVTNLSNELVLKTVSFPPGGSALAGTRRRSSNAKSAVSVNDTEGLQFALQGLPRLINNGVGAEDVPRAFGTALKRWKCLRPPSVGTPGSLQHGDIRRRIFTRDGDVGRTLGGFNKGAVPVELG